MDTAITNFTSAANSGNGITAAAGALITATDAAINAVSAQRANYGAVENRLNHTVASIGVASLNLNASMSRIKDLDVAAEMVNFTKTQILQQAGTSILAQANQAPQNILTLLR
jgi:flagellin